MRRLAWIELIVCWTAFFAAFALRGKWQRGRRPATTDARAMWGLLLESVAIAIAGWPSGGPPGAGRMAASMVLAPVGVGLAWWAVEHLGTQLRVQAGLWPDHRLVRSGPYALVRHPIYLSLFLMMLATALLRAAWPVMALAAAIFATGTEIRIRIEDRLLAARFGGEFEEYHGRVRAWLPPLR
jgi:protein-S-isoprenylcysteine O-methyltransferase Ste14